MSPVLVNYLLIFRQSDWCMEKKEVFQRKEEKKKFISIYWKCCHVFSRMYRNSSGTGYDGFCPKCHVFLHVPIGKDGIHQRTFIAE